MRPGNRTLATSSRTSTATATRVPPAPSSSGQGPCDTQMGDTCLLPVASPGAGLLTVTITGSSSFGGTVALPGTALVGSVPQLFIPTTLRVETVPTWCTAISAAFATSCAGTTAGTPLPDGFATIRFALAAGGTQDLLAGPITPRPRPLLPPPPPVLLPPSPPPPLVRLPAVGPVAPSAGPLEVPVIPESETLLLLGVGLAALGLVARPWRRRR